jgi:hypothetical protein
MSSEDIVHKKERLYWIDKFNKFNETLDIYRTIIITKTTCGKEEIANALQQEGYDIYISSDDNLDFDIFLQKHSRIFLTTISEFYNYTPVVLKIMSNEHNMLILDNITLNVDNIIESIKNKEKIKDNYYVWKTT